METFSLTRIGEGNVLLLQINVLSVGNPYSMARVILLMWLRGEASNTLKNPIEV